MVCDENEYACDMLPYDTALNTIGFEMRKNRVVPGIGYIISNLDISNKRLIFSFQGVSQWHWTMLM